MKTKYVECSPDKLSMELEIFKAEIRMGFRKNKDEWSEIIIKDVIKEDKGYIIKYKIDWLYWKEI